MKNNKNLAFLGFMGAMLATTTSNFRHSNEEVVNKSKSEPKRIIPKGCKEYFFTAHHGLFTVKPRSYIVVFECIAFNEKSAKKKFVKWLDSLPVCECKNGLEFEQCDVKCDRRYFEN